MATRYRKQHDGSYKKVVLVEKIVNGKLQLVDEYELLKGKDGLPGESIVGPKGNDGKDGKDGKDGRDGLDGQIGPMGPQGEVGPKGPQGEKGEKGDKGDKGDQGIQGIQGEKGEKGEKGDKGDIGQQGIQGLQGPRGEQGVQGEKGEKGDIGPRGFMGPIGPTGPQGATGPAGKRGERGERGERGFPGVGAQGVGISSTDIVNNYLIITYTTGATQNAGYIAGGTGSGGGSTTYTEVKTGIVSGASFSGTTLYYDVTFDTPYTYNLYSISIMGDDVRTWSVSGKTMSGFRIESNSIEPIVGDVYWIASYGSGSIQSNNRRGINSTFAASFLGIWKTTVTFTDPLTSTYSISVTGDDVRTWSVENVTLTGFDISSNSSVQPTGNVYWQCIEV